MLPWCADTVIGRGSSSRASCSQRPASAVASPRRQAAPFFVTLVLPDPLRAALHLPPCTASHTVRGIRRQSQAAELLAKASLFLVEIEPRPEVFDIGAPSTPNPRHSPDVEARPASLHLITLLLDVPRQLKPTAHLRLRPNEEVRGSGRERVSWSAKGARPTWRPCARAFIRRDDVFVVEQPQERRYVGVVVDRSGLLRSIE